MLGHEGFYGGHGGGDSSPPCDSSEPGDIFRRVDGVCNNLNNRHWGAAGIPMRRHCFAALTYPAVNTFFHQAAAGCLWRWILDTSSAATPCWPKVFRRISLNKAQPPVPGTSPTACTLLLGQGLSARKASATWQCSLASSSTMTSPSPHKQVKVKEINAVLTGQSELDCCNTTFLALDQALPPALQRCLNIPITNDTFPNLSCFSFTR